MKWLKNAEIIISVGCLKVVPKIALPQKRRRCATLSFWVNRLIRTEIFQIILVYECENINPSDYLKSSRHHKSVESMPKIR